MSWATAIVLIVLITAIAGVFRQRSGRSRRHEDAAQVGISERERALEDEVEQLRERIHVLERIATDNHSPDAIETRRISEEIEKLREGQSDGPRKQEG